MKMLTVMDMYLLMQDLIAQGKGDLLVLMPNRQMKIMMEITVLSEKLITAMSLTLVYICVAITPKKKINFGKSGKIDNTISNYLYKYRVDI